MEEIQKAILDAVETVISNKLKDLSFSYYIDGFITSAKNLGTQMLPQYVYTVENQETILKDIRARSYLTPFLKEGIAVQVIAKNGSLANTFIDEIL